MIAEHKGEVPAFIYLLPFIAGIVAGISFDTPLFVVIIATAFSLLAFLSLNFLYSPLRVYQFNWTGGLLAHIIIFCFGLLAVQLNNERIYHTYFGKQTADHLLVTINNEPALKGKYLHCTAKVEETFYHKIPCTAAGKILLTILADSIHHIQYGDQLLIPAINKPVDPPRNPAVFNYKAYLGRQHIYQQCFLYPGQYAVVNHDRGNAIIAASYRLRQHMVQKIRDNMADTTAAAVASTLILGYKADLSAEVLQSYSKTGTIHVLSVSGAHVAIVFVFISFLLGFLNVSRPGQWIKAMVIIVLIWAYAMLTGFSPAVCRAALMLSFAIIGTAGYRYNNAVNLLAVSAFILLLYDPLLIADVGFQLSYLAVFGLIVLQPIINKWLSFRNKWLGKLWYLLSASLAAQVITFPLSAFYFHQFPVYFLISNLLIIIPSEIILGGGLIAVLMPKLPYLTKGAFWMVEKSILLMNAGLKFIEQQPYASIDKLWFNLLDCVLLFLFIALLFYFLYSKTKAWLWAALICLLIFSISTTIQKVLSDETNSVIFYSLNKHPAILFKSGDTGTLFTDLNSADPNFKYDVQPAIDSNRIAHLTLAKLDTNLKTHNLQSRFGLIQFRDKRLFILNERPAYFNLKAKLKVDYLYFTANPHRTIRNINEHFVYKKLIIDGTNSAQNIKKLSAEADSLHQDYFILKRNKALVLLSN